MNINKLLQLAFHLLLLASTVGFLLCVVTTLHLPVMPFLVIIAIIIAIVYTALLVENTTNQEEEEK